MTYQESVNWLFEQYPAYQKIGISAYKPDLDNVLELCDKLEVNFSSLLFIHIAGTNGKGSTANYLASIFQEASYKTGLFTSPHILDFRERIRVNGEMISPEKVVHFCEKIKNTSFEIQPSFFEITWILALIHFIETGCEICIIETGLGGRLDATNIITPILSIITNVSLDHTDILGDTIQAISREKAGIIKPGIPVLIGNVKSEAHSIFEEIATERKAYWFDANDFLSFESIFPENSYPYQNEKLVRAAVNILNQSIYAISEQEIRKGLQNVTQNTGFMGRLQIVAESPLILLDAAHNEDGIKQLITSIEQYDFNRLYILYGASKDKDVTSIISLFPSHADIHLCSFSNQRSLNTEQLYTLQKNIRQQTSIHSSIEKAYQSIQQTINEDDMILVTGSFFLLQDFFYFFNRNTC